MSRGLGIIGSAVLAALCVLGAKSPMLPEPVTWMLWAVPVLMGLAWLYFYLAGVSVLAVFLRAFLALFPVGFVAAGLIFLVTQIEGLADAEVRAIIAATVVAAGWVVGFVTTEWRAATQEQERRRDIVKAALTEIELIVTHGDSANWADVIQETQDSFFKDRRYHVFVYYGHQFGTLRRLVGQIEILREDQIRPVMDFFQLLDRLERMELRMATAEYAALPSERREAGVVRYLNMQSAVPKVGRKAADALKAQTFQGWLRHFK